MKVKYDFWKMLDDIYSSRLNQGEKESAMWLDKFDFIKLHMKAFNLINAL